MVEVSAAEVEMVEMGEYHFSCALPMILVFKNASRQSLVADPAALKTLLEQGSLIYPAAQ